MRTLCLNPPLPLVVHVPKRFGIGIGPTNAVPSMARMTFPHTYRRISAALFICYLQMSGMAGSKRFMSPEVCKGLPYNEKVDVYSFGIVLWELCTLRKPFAGMSVDDHYHEVIVGGLRPPLDPRWPAGLQRLLRACWHEDPDQRPSILEAKEVLRRTYLDGGGWDY